MIVNSRNEGAWLKQTVENLADTLPGDSEIVVVDDGSDDGSADFLQASPRKARVLRTEQAGMARSRNHGARNSTGDYLIFSDAHMRYDKHWWRALVEIAAQPHAGAAGAIVGSTRDHVEFGYGFTIPKADLAPAWLPNRDGANPFQVPIAPGCCLAMNRAVFEATGGYDQAMRSRGSVDAELGLRFWLLGYENWMAPSSRVWHHFREHAPFHIPRRDAMHNRLRTALVHFNAWRVSSVFRAIHLAGDHGDASLGPALLQVMEGNVLERRRQLLASRIHNDDWFFERFEIRW